MLATAKKLADTEAALKIGRADHAAWQENFDRQDREITATLEQVKNMRAEWEVKMIYAQAEADRIVREAIPPRRIPFNTPADHQPLETPKDNMQKAAELLKKTDEEVDINYLRTLVASAVQQQSKADTSRRLESNPDNCVSTAQKDDESHTGSSERRRKARSTQIRSPFRHDASIGSKEGKGRDVHPDLLGDLEKNSIFCWFDLKNALRNTSGTYKRPQQATYGLASGRRAKHRGISSPDGGDLAATAIPLHQQKKNRDNGGSHKRKNPDDQKSGGSEMVAMAFQRGGPGGEEDADARRAGSPIPPRSLPDPRTANL
ncbi:hypothetical protein QYE76_024889 [Lolium multiflorum]|uniref:Uncharacterized protein n=1 Tax=Lolium multiflorum TaxID=4521 RepID=A0AAD8RE51_LOLMU|nr:hypothetical protein QYE76_024889 [Lolium multiflorum]